MNEPEQYGGLGCVERENENCKAKKDLLIIGKNGKIWKPLITKIAKEKYTKHQILYDTYKKNFKPKKYIN